MMAEKILIYKLEADLKQPIREIEKLIDLQGELVEEQGKLRADRKKLQAELTKLTKTEAKGVELSAEQLKNRRELGKEIGKLNQQLKETSREQTILNREFSKIDSAADSYDQLTLKTAKLERLLKSISPSTEGFDLLSRKVRESKDQIIAFDQSLKNGKTNVGNYSAALIEATQGARELNRQTFDRLQSEQKDLITQIKKLQKEYDSFGDKGTVAAQRVATKIQNIDGSLKKVNRDLTATQKKLQGLGKGVDAGGNIGKILGGFAGGFAAAQIAQQLVEAGRAILEFSNKAGDAFAKVSAVFDGTEEQLVDLTADILATSQVFNTDLKESIEAVNAASKEFGISGEKALGEFNKTLLLTQGLGDNIADNFKEYSTQAAAAGLSIEEFSSILIRSAKEGVFSDKLIDSVKEARIEITELSKGAVEGLTALGFDVTLIQKELANGTKNIDEVIAEAAERIGKLPKTSQKAAVAIKGIFKAAGEDAGQRAIATLADLNKEIDLSTQKLTKQQQIQLQTLELRSQLNELGVTLNKALLPVFLDIVKGINNATSETGEFTKEINSLVDNFQDLKTVVDETIGFTQDLTNALSFGLFDKANESISKNISLWTILKEAIKTALGISALESVAKVSRGIIKVGNLIRGLSNDILGTDFEIIKTASEERAIKETQAIQDKARTEQGKKSIAGYNRDLKNYIKIAKDKAAAEAPILAGREKLEQRLSELYEKRTKARQDGNVDGLATIEAEISKLEKFFGVKQAGRKQEVDNEKLLIELIVKRNKLEADGSTKAAANTTKQIEKIKALLGLVSGSLGELDTKLKVSEKELENLKKERELKFVVGTKEFDESTAKIQAKIQEITSQKRTIEFVLKASELEAKGIELQEIEVPTIDLFGTTDEAEKQYIDSFNTIKQLTDEQTRLQDEASRKRIAAIQRELTVKTGFQSKDKQDIEQKKALEQELFNLKLQLLQEEEASKQAAADAEVLRIQQEGEARTASFSALNTALGEVIGAYALLTEGQENSAAIQEKLNAFLTIFSAITKINLALAELENIQAIRNQALTEKQTAAAVKLAVAKAASKNILQIGAIIAALFAGFAAIKSLTKFEKGGLIGGKRHSQGGTVIEAEKGEIIMNRGVYGNSKSRDYASALNEIHGGTRLPNVTGNYGNVLNEMRENLGISKMRKMPNVKFQSLIPKFANGGLVQGGGVSGELEITDIKETNKLLKAILNKPNAVIPVREVSRMQEQILADEARRRI